LTLSRNVRYDVVSMGRSRRWRFGWLVVLWITPAIADVDAESVKSARKRFIEGVAAADAGNYEAARAAFQQAYTLKPHPSTLRNLGEAELKTGHFLDAARHLAQFVHGASFGSADDLARAKKALTRAEAKIGRLLVAVDVDGAAITVDGEAIGTSPLQGDPVYLDTGRRIVRIEKDGYQLYEQAQTLEPGRVTELRVMMKPKTLEPAMGSAASVSRAADPPLEPLPTDNVGPPPLQLRATEASPARTTVMVTTGALAAVSATVWIGFALRSSSLSSDASDMRARLGGNACVVETPACADLRDLAEKRADANKVAIAGAVGTGLFGAAFIAAWQLWPTTRTVGATLTPDFGAGHAGFIARGSF
jgi:hypothetical protein